MFHLISSQLFPSCHLTSCLDTSAVLIFSPLLSSSHIIGSHLKLSSSVPVPLFSLCSLLSCFQCPILILSPHIFVFPCLFPLMSSPKLSSFHIFHHSLSRCHLTSCISSCLIHWFFIWLHLVLSPLNAIPLLVSSPSLVFMYFCRPLSCLPVNKSCYSLRSLCPWFLSPCGLWKVQNCHCLQTVLCVTPPCQHSFFWAQSGLSLIPVHPLVWPHLSLSLSLTSPSSQLASTLTPASLPNNAQHKSLSIKHAV